MIAHPPGIRYSATHAQIASTSTTSLRASHVDFIGSDFKKYPTWENAVKIQKWSGKTKITINLPKR
jgi:hypothetical protein